MGRGVMGQNVPPHNFQAIVLKFGKIVEFSLKIRVLLADALDNGIVVYSSTCLVIAKAERTFYFL